MEITIKHGQIIKFVDHDITEIGDNFLERNKTLAILVMDNLTRMNNDCFSYNENIASLNLPQLTHMGNGCFYWNETITFKAPLLN